MEALSQYKASKQENTYLSTTHEELKSVVARGGGIHLLTNHLSLYLFQLISHRVQLAPHVFHLLFIEFADCRSL